MRLEFTPQFEDDYARLPDQIQLRADKALEMLLKNPRHPSLQVKKMQGNRGIWEARVTLSYRMTFKIANDVIVMRRVGPHSIESTP